METKPVKPPFVKGDILVSDYHWENSELRGAITVPNFSAARRHFKSFLGEDPGQISGIVWRATRDAKADNSYADGWELGHLTVGWFELATLADIREAIRKTRNARQLARLERWLGERKTSKGARRC